MSEARELAPSNRMWCSAAIDGKFHLMLHLDATRKPDLLDRIDEVTADVCHQCGHGLDDSVSEWFCSPWCQQQWTAHRNDVAELTGYVEPLGGYGCDAYSTSGHAVNYWGDEDEVTPRWAPVHIPDWGAMRRVWSEGVRFPQSSIRLQLHVLSPSPPETPTARNFQFNMRWVSGQALQWMRPEWRPAGRVFRVEPQATRNDDVGRLDLTWLDHYVPGLDDHRDHIADAQVAFPPRPIAVPPGVELVDDSEATGPQGHADPRRNRRGR